MHFDMYINTQLLTFSSSKLVRGEVVEYLVQGHVHPHPVLVREVLGVGLGQKAPPLILLLVNLHGDRRG